MHVLPGNPRKADLEVDRRPHRAQRLNRLWLAIGSSLLTTPLALLVPLVTVSLFTKSLGQARYGLFETVVALTTFLGMANLGMTLGLLNKLTDCQVSGDQELARRYSSSPVLAMLALVAAAVVLF